MTAAELLAAIAASTERSERRSLLARFVQTNATRNDFAAILVRMRPAIRVQAAAMALEIVPDNAETVMPILDAVTANLGKSHSLQRLIELQSKVAKCLTLDEVIEASGIRTKLACPKCEARLPRVTLIRHLWFKHRLVFEKGRARVPGSFVEAAIQKALATNDPLSIDHVYELANICYRSVSLLQIHQALTSRLDRDPEELEPLQQAAKEHRSGLCPRCLAPVPCPVPELPPPLNLAHGRLSGEGYHVVLGPVSSNRAKAMKWSLPFAIFGSMLTLVLQPPFGVFVIATLVTLLVYFLMWRHGATSPDDTVVDRAWRDLVPRIGRSVTAVRFLTRLCRTSLDHGETTSRSDAVWSQVEQAAVLSGKGGVYVQWFATVRVLQAFDASHFGYDWIPSLVGILAPLFRAEASPAYAEAVAETLIDSQALKDNDAARLRVALAAQAFAVGLTPTDLVLLENTCPNLDRLFAGNEMWFQSLHAVWRGRNRRDWQVNGDAQTVFEYAANPAAGNLLATYPDTLLVMRFDEPTDRELGPVVIGHRGVTVAGCTVSELNTAIDVQILEENSVLHFGPHKILAERKLPRHIVGILTGWLQYREELLAYVKSSQTDQLDAILAPLVTECPLCSERVLVKVGELCQPWK